MTEITALLGEASTLFGAIVVLATTVTGFFIGRRWLKRV